MKPIQGFSHAARIGTKTLPVILTTGDFILFKARQEPVGGVFDPREHNDSQVADIHADVPLKGDHPHALLHDICTRRQERAPRGRSSLQSDKK